MGIVCLLTLLVNFSFALQIDDNVYIKPSAKEVNYFIANDTTLDAIKISDSSLTTTGSGEDFIFARTPAILENATIYEFDVTGYNERDSITQNNFTAKAVNTDLSYNSEVSTTTGEAILFVENESYDFTITSDGFSKISFSNNTEDLNYQYNASFYPESSIVLSFFDEITGEPIIGPLVEVRITNDQNQVLANTTTGILVSDTIPSGEYIVTSTATNYTMKTNNIIIEQDATNFANVYLTPNVTETTDILFSITDTKFEALSNAKITIRGPVNGTFETVYELLTDVAGDALATLIADQTYFVDVEKDGYEPELNIRIELERDTYPISLKDEGQNIPDDVYLGVYTKLTPEDKTLFTDELHAFNWTTDTSEGVISRFTLYIEYPDATNFTEIKFENGGTITTGFQNLTNYENETINVFGCFIKEGYNQVCVKQIYTVRPAEPDNKNLLALREYLTENVSLAQRIALWISFIIGFTIVFAIFPFFRGNVAFYVMAILAFFFGWLFLSTLLLIIVTVLMFIGLLYMAGGETY